MRPTCEIYVIICPRNVNDLKKEKNYFLEFLRLKI